MTTKWPEVSLGDVTLPVTKRDPVRSGSASFTYIDLSSVDRGEKRVTQETTMHVAEAPSRARQVVADGDVLVSTVRPNLNAVAQVPLFLDGATASTGFTVLRPRKEHLHPRYLFHWVCHPSFVAEMVRLATGASYPAVADRIVKASRVSLPPVEEQRRIAAILDVTDELRAKRRRSMALLDSLAESSFLDMFGDPAVNERRFCSARLGDLAIKFSDGPFGSNLKSSHYVERGVRVVRLQNIGCGTFIEDDAVYITASQGG